MNLIISFVSAGIGILIGAALGYAVGQAMTADASLYMGTTILGAIIGSAVGLKW